MPPFKDRVAKTQKKLKKLMNLDYTPAKVGDGKGNIKIGFRPGYVWVRVQSADGRLSKPFPVLYPTNSPVLLYNGANVQLGWDRLHRRIIADGDTTNTLANGIDSVDTSSANLPTSQGQSSPQISIETLRVIASNPLSFEVSVRAWFIITGRKIFRMSGESGVDISGAIPASGLKCYAGLFISNDYTSFSVTSSTPRDITDIDLNDDDIQECVDGATDTDTPIWFIPVNGDLANISQAIINNGIDARQIVNFANRIYNFTPANTADASGLLNDITYDASFLYVKTDTGWKQVAISSF